MGIIYGLCEFFHHSSAGARKKLNALGLEVAFAKIQTRKKIMHVKRIF